MRLLDVPVLMKPKEVRRKSQAGVSNTVSATKNRATTDLDSGNIRDLLSKGSDHQDEAGVAHLISVKGGSRGR